jgi:hypothetical protein
MDVLREKTDVRWVGFHPLVMPVLKMLSRTRSINDTSRVIRIMIVGDATSWSITSEF